MDKFIIISGKRYTYYETFNTHEEALMIAKYHKKDINNRSYILTVELSGLSAGIKRYRLYMTRILGKII